MPQAERMDIPHASFEGSGNAATAARLTNARIAETVSRQNMAPYSPAAPPRAIA
jgi:hypothetical protein